MLLGAIPALSLKLRLGSAVFTVIQLKDALIIGKGRI